MWSAISAGKLLYCIQTWSSYWKYLYISPSVDSLCRKDGTSFYCVLGMCCNNKRLASLLWMHGVLPRKKKLQPPRVKIRWANKNIFVHIYYDALKIGLSREALNSSTFYVKKKEPYLHEKPFHRTLRLVSLYPIRGTTVRKNNKTTTIKQNKNP